MQALINTLTKTLVAGLLVAGATNAQSLDGEVQRDPNADLAIYTVHLDGPPNGTAFLFGSLSIAPPYQIPGVINPLFLDPLSILQLGPGIPLDASGQMLYQFHLPMTALEDQHLHFQSIVIDTAFNIAATNLFCGVQGAAPAALPAGNLEWNGTYRTNPHVYILKVKGVAGANVRLLVNGGQKAEGGVVLDENGEGTIEVPVDLDKGDGLSIEQNGQHVHGWTWD